MTDLAPDRCPLCAGPNRCAMAAGGTDASACWCTSVRFSAALLDRIPQAQRGVACVCASCAAPNGPDRAALPTEP